MKNLLSVLALALVTAFALSAPEAFAQKKSRFREGSEVRGTRKPLPSKKKGASTSSARRARPSVVSNPREHNIVREDGQNVVYKKRNVVDFDDSLIEGEVKNPSEFYFVHRPEEKFGSLVKKRKNFHKEMLRDTVMIR